MELTIQNHDDGVCLAQAKGRIDTLTSREFGERLTGLIAGGSRRLVVDLTQVAYISSAGFRALLLTAKQMETARGRLALTGVAGEVRRLFDIAALTELFTLCATPEDGLANVRADESA